VPGLPKNDTLAHGGAWLHVVVGQWAVYAFILLHVAATAWHVAVRRDGVLDRMLPEQHAVATGATHRHATPASERHPA